MHNFNSLTLKLREELEVTDGGEDVTLFPFIHKYVAKIYHNKNTYFSLACGGVKI